MGFSKICLLLHKKEKVEALFGKEKQPYASSETYITLEIQRKHARKLGSLEKFRILI